MYNKVLHNIKKIPFNERETFNNAIILLSMVKSEFYYIVGFSRPDNIIEIGFDFNDILGEVLTETVTVDFSYSSDSIKIKCDIKNLLFDKSNEVFLQCDDNFVLKDDGSVMYEKCYEKDSLFPVGMEKLNTLIMSTKEEIRAFLKKGVVSLLSS